MLSRSVLLAAGLATGGALAQTAPQPASQTAPRTASQIAAPAAPPPLKYESTFTGYQPYRDDKRGDWRALNDTVGALRGHAGHLRGTAADAPAPAPATMPTPAAATAPVPGAPANPKPAPADPHAGHKR